MTTIKRGACALSRGGESWAGFMFQSWGKARDWRLILPTGEALTADEIADVRRLQADLCYLHGEVSRLTAKASGVALAFTGDEAQLLRVALGVLLRELPVQLRRRDCRVTPGGLLRAV